MGTLSCRPFKKQAIGAFSSAFVHPAFGLTAAFCSTFRAEIPGWPGGIARSDGDCSSEPVRIGRSKTMSDDWIRSVEAAVPGVGADSSHELCWAGRPVPQGRSKAAEIEGWLDDDQQLSELGRRAVMVMLGRHPSVEVVSGTPAHLLIQQLLARDWLQHHI